MKSKSTPDLSKKEINLMDEFLEYCRTDEEYNALSNQLTKLYRTKTSIQDALRIFHIYIHENFNEQVKRLKNEELKQMAFKLHGEFLKCDQAEMNVYGKLNEVSENRLALAFITSKMISFELCQDKIDAK